MTFENALSSVRSGYTVTRTGWTGKSLRMVIPEPGAGESYIELTVNTKTIKTRYTASEKDLLADDWQVV